MITWDTGDGIASVALILSIVATYTSWRFNRDQKAFMETQERLNRLLLEKEAGEVSSGKRADLGASFLKLGRSYRLKIYNKGKCPARNVRLEFPDGNSLILEDDIRDKFPFQVLDVHQAVELVAAVHMGSQSKLAVRLLWEDDFSPNNEKTLYATL